MVCNTTSNDYSRVCKSCTLYVVVIARCRMQYGKYFPSFSYFATYFTSLYANGIIATYQKREKYLPILLEAPCDEYFIVKCLRKSNIARVILPTS